MKKKTLNIKIFDIDKTILFCTPVRPGGDGSPGGTACGGCHGTVDPESQAENANIAGAVAGAVVGNAIGGPIGGMVGSAVGAGVANTGPCGPCGPCPCP